MKITVQTLVKAPMADVWQAYVTPADIMQWNAASDDWHTPHAEVDLRVGGRFLARMEARDGSMGFDFEGVYTRITEHRDIAYRFGDREAEVVFAEEAGGVRVKVTFDAEDTHTIQQQSEGWQAILDNFAKHVESKAA